MASLPVYPIEDAGACNQSRLPDPGAGNCPYIKNQQLQLPFKNCGRTTKPTPESFGFPAEIMGPFLKKEPSSEVWAAEKNFLGSLHACLISFIY